MGSGAVDAENSTRILGVQPAGRAHGNRHLMSPSMAAFCATAMLLACHLTGLCTMSKEDEALSKLALKHEVSD